MRFRTAGISFAALVFFILPFAAEAGERAGEESAPPDEMTFHQDLAWSPDGSRIAFSARTVSRARWEAEKYKALEGTDYEIYVMEPDGSGLRQLTDNAADDVWLSWSPDGERLVFSSDREGSQDLYVMRSDGSGVTRLTSDPGAESAPAWSPDGATIAFMAKEDDHWQLRVMNADGSGQREVASGTVNTDNPVWSPDGERLAYYASPGGPGHDQVFVVSIEAGAEPRAVTDGIFPSWSPDGKSLLLSRDHALYAVDTDGTNLRELAEDGFFARYAPDGKRIALVTGRFPETRIVVIPAGGAHDGGS